MIHHDNGWPGAERLLLSLDPPRSSPSDHVLQRETGGARVSSNTRQDRGPVTSARSERDTFCSGPSTRPERL